MRLRRVLEDKGLAGFGDALVNFLYSLAATRRLGRPVGMKIENRVLADAVRKAKLRRLLPRRLDEKAMGNYAEALIAYAWFNRFLTTEKCVEILVERLNNPTDAFTKLLETASEALRDRDQDC